MPEIADLLLRPASERFNGAAAWAQLTTEAQAAIGALALELALTWNIENRSYEDDLPVRFDRAAIAARREIERALTCEIVDALPADAFVASDERLPRIPSLLGGVCSVCGCSQNDACAEGCGWAAEDLCTACVEGEHDHG